MINAGYTYHLKKPLNGIPKKNVWKEAKHIMQILPNENISHGGNDIQNREIGNTRDDYKGHGKHNVDVIRGTHQKLFGHRIHPNNERTIQYVTIESKYGFLKTTSFKLKNSSKNFVVFGQQWKKNINAQHSPKKIKK